VVYSRDGRFAAQLRLVGADHFPLVSLLSDGSSGRGLVCEILGTCFQEICGIVEKGRDGTFLHVGRLLATTVGCLVYLRELSKECESRR
jgi:hypothetical protein